MYTFTPLVDRYQIRFTLTSGRQVIPRINGSHEFASKASATLTAQMLADNSASVANYTVLTVLAPETDLTAEG